jgi:hypothetical protein
MRNYSSGLQPDVANPPPKVSRFVSAVPIVVIAAWLFAGAASLAGPPTRPVRAIATRPYSDVTQVFPGAVMTRSAKVAAIDEDEDGDDDQAAPDDPNDTLAAADASWWGAPMRRCGQA